MKSWKSLAYILVCATLIFLIYYSAKPMSISRWVTPDDSLVMELASTIKSTNNTGKALELYCIVTSMDYIEDCGDYWQTPEETIIRGAGDCEDFTFLLASLFIAAGLEKPAVMFGSYNEGGHAWVEWNNKAFESTNFAFPFPTSRYDALGYTVKYRVIVEG